MYMFIYMCENVSNTRDMLLGHQKQLVEHTPGTSSHGLRCTAVALGAPISWLERQRLGSFELSRVNRIAQPFLGIAGAVPSDEYVVSPHTPF